MTASSAMSGSVRQQFPTWHCGKGASEETALRRDSNVNIASIFVCVAMINLLGRTNERTNNNAMDRPKENYKTSLCRHYMTKGVCSLYDKCYFAHGNQELRRKTDPLPGYLPSPLRPVSIYKTQLCKYFMNGYCRNDDKCPFAHGSVDLHSMLVESTGVAPPIMAPIMTPPPTSIRTPMLTPIRPPTMTSPPPSAPANLKPDYGQAGEFLCSILRNLEQVFPQGEVKQHILLKKGLQLIESGDLPQVNEIINEIVNSTCLSEKQREACQTILSNAYSLHRITFLNF